MPASLFTAAHRELVTAVKELRKKAGLSQRELADALGREQNLVARIETGQRRVDFIEFVQICRACGAEPVGETTKLARIVAELTPTRRRARN
jgi:transcriptional regulator with XRE-family HTH domain